MKVIISNIENEVTSPVAPNCFLGAWYFKVFSSRDKWLGIEGVIKLPEVDIKRYDGFKNLDTPSIYMGGLSKFESDVGLSYNRGYIKDDNGNLVISESGITFRPFWRYITDLKTDEGSYDYKNNRNYNVSNLGTNNGISNCYAMYSPNYSEYYYLPGDIVKIMITYPKKNYMMLEIKVIEESKLESSVNLRRKNGWKSPKDFTSPLFTSPEDSTGLKEFKRVNAIDQSSNEGKPTINTKTSIKNAIWESVYLYREVNGEVVKVPLNERRSATMTCPIVSGFNFNMIDPETGSQKIDIVPGESYEK